MYEKISHISALAKQGFLAILLPSLLSQSLLILNLERTDLFKTHQNPWWISGNRCCIAIRLPSPVPFLQTLLSQYATKKKTANKLSGVVHILLYWGHSSFPQQGREGGRSLHLKKNIFENSALSSWKSFTRKQQSDFRQVRSSFRAGQRRGASNSSCSCFAYIKLFLNRTLINSEKYIAKYTANRTQQ